jgi:hypothetical protein
MMMTCLNPRNRDDGNRRLIATIILTFSRLTPLLFAAFILSTFGPAPKDALAQNPSQLSAFDQFVSSGRKALADGNLDEGMISAHAAIKDSEQRFEGYALAALVAEKQGKTAEALAYVEKALARASEPKKAQLEEIKRRLRQSSPPLVGQNPSPSALSGEARRKFNALLIIAEEADKAKNETERRKLLEEFLTRSDEFLYDNPSALPIWTLRAASGLELNRPRLAWEAGRKLMALGADQDVNAEKILAKLDRKGWLSESLPNLSPKAGHNWENSLGMKFTPVGGTQVYFCIWETRVQDYSVYAEANPGVNGTWHDAKAGNLISVSKGPNYPVVNVSWEDAENFCAWLTKKEQAEGRLQPSQSYRLPTDLEWSAAVGLGKETGDTPSGRTVKTARFYTDDTLIVNAGEYPWGTQWPPPQGAGNYGDKSLRAQFSNAQVIEGYDDGFVTTSPVGTFSRNQYGLYDLSGNVSEWCNDWFDKHSQERVQRGGSWLGWLDSVSLWSSYRFHSKPDIRTPIVGFRVVLAGVEELSMEAQQKSDEKPDLLVKRAPAEQLTLNQYRERLLFTHDAEWSVIRPLIEKVLAASAEVGGLTAPTGPEAEQLRKALKSGASSAELNATLATLRAAHGAPSSTTLANAQDNLRKLLSIYQEALAVDFGLLQ